MGRRLTHEERATLVYTGSSVKELWPIAERLGWLEADERDWAAARLVEHPRYTPEALQVTLDALNVEWWGDDPGECSAAIRALEQARDAARNRAD